MKNYFGHLPGLELEVSDSQDGSLSLDTQNVNFFI